MGLFIPSLNKTGFTGLVVPFLRMLTMLHVVLPMKKLSVLPGLCSGSTLASLTLHGGLIALALLLGGQASLPQEKVYRVSLAQMAASVRPAAAPGLPDGGAAAPVRAITPQEVIKTQEKQQPQPPQPVNNMQTTRLRESTLTQIALLLFVHIGKL